MPHPVSVLNCEDFDIGVPALRTVHERNAYDGGGGINYWVTRDGNAINTIVLDGVEYQAITYWSEVSTTENRLYLTFCKNRGHFVEHLTTIVLTGAATDAHFTIAGEFDPTGVYHIWYDMHSEPIKYRKTTQAVSDPAFSATFTAPITTMVNNTNEQSMSYPTPFRDRGSNHLYYWFRNGGAGQGGNLLYRLNHLTGVWAAAPGTGTNGQVVGDTTQVAYSAAPTCTTDWDAAGNGFIVFGWTWRDDPSTNSYHDSTVVFYDGSGFFKSNGTSQTLPVTVANADIIEPAVIGDAIERPRLAAGINGRVHACYRHNGILTHKWWNPSTGLWTENAVVASTLNAPTLVVRSDGTAIIFGVDASDLIIKKHTSNPNDYATWTAATQVWATALPDYDWHAIHDLQSWYLFERCEMLVPLLAIKPTLRDARFGFKLDEANGARNYCTKTGTLQDTNTVLSGTGRIYALAADFEADNQERLRDSDDATTSVTGSMSAAFWVNLESKTSNRGIFGKYLSTGEQRSYSADYVGGATDRIQWAASGSGTSGTTVGVLTPTAPSVATWHLVIVDTDLANDVIGIQIDNGVRNTTAYTHAQIFDSTADFTIGRGSSTVATSQMDGLVGPLFVWDKVLTTEERAFLWNGGAGRTWEDMARIGPTIYTHETGEVNVPAGETGVVSSLGVYGDLDILGASLTGADADLFILTDNGEGASWDLDFENPAVAGTYEVGISFSSMAGTDQINFTVNVSGGPHVSLGGLHGIEGGISA